MPREGEVLEGRYRVGRVIAVGGIGVVVAAAHVRLDEPVALKFLRPESMKNPEVVRRFAREGRACCRIRSEHVVRAYDVGYYGDLPYLVLERLVGADLDEVIDRSGPLPLPTAVDYLLQACEALAEAHAAGLVHRDLKPANLFLTRRADGSPCIKVLDFGLSKFVGPGDRSSGLVTLRTATSELVGSPSYMSPEQLSASAVVD